MSAEPHANDAAWTIGRLLSWTSDYLTRNGVDDARLASEVLLAHATRRRRIDLYARPEEIPDPEEVGRFRTLVKQAAAHEPIAYLVGEKEFFSLTFKVTREVLIPRPETETLVEGVIDHCVRMVPAEPRLIDLGTGCGCIAVALLTQVKGARVVATDVSRAALAVAKENAVRHGVADRLIPVEADRLALPAKVVPEGGFDVLVSNPPYVAAATFRKLGAGVRAYEPEAALTDGGDGLSFYRSIAADAPGLLAPEGVVFVEVGDGQSRAVRETVEQAGTLVQQRSWKDQVVGQERVLMFGRV